MMILYLDKIKVITIGVRSNLRVDLTMKVKNLDKRMACVPRLKRYRDRKMRKGCTNLCSKSNNSNIKTKDYLEKQKPQEEAD